MVNLYVMKEAAPDFYDPQGGIDALVLPAMTDLKEAWYGIEIDKKKYQLVLEDETEETVYLKIVKLQPQQEKKNEVF